MAGKDIIEKMLLDYADVFADVINVGLFDGERLMNPWDLETVLPRSVYKAKSDFRLVADFFSQKRKNGNYTPDNTTITHVAELLELFAAVTGDNRFTEAYDDDYLKGRPVTMEAVLDAAEHRGFTRGISQGISQGISHGESKLGQLISLLIENGRTEDVGLAATDRERREELYRQYHIE